MKQFLPWIFTAAMLGGVASATVVNIDFGTTTGYQGLAAAPDPEGSGAIWNDLNQVSGTASSVALNDSAGNATSIGFQLTGITDDVNFTSGNGELAGGYLSLMRDYVRIDSLAGDVVIEISGKFTGLSVGGSYDLYFYGQGQNMAPDLNTNRGQNSLFTVGSVSKQTGWDGVAGGNGAFAESISASQQGEYVKFTAIADSNGEIIFRWANVVTTGTNPNATEDYAPSTSPSVGSRYAALNAIQLTAVPEPSVMLLAALGALGLLRRRR